MNSTEEMQKVWEHIETVNREMGEVKTHITYIRDKVEIAERKTWYIISGIIVSILIGIYTALI